MTSIAQSNQPVRVLHSAALLSPPSGILAQMDSEQQAADSLGLPWQVRMYCPKNGGNQAAILHPDESIDASQLQSPLRKLRAWLTLRRNYYRWLERQQEDFDIFLLRYYVHDPFQLAFVRRCSKPVFFVHHTLEVPELALPGGISGFVRSKLEALIGPPTIRKATGVIGVTQEIVNYELGRAKCTGKTSYVYPNGILFEELALEDHRSPDVPELLFVANFAPWHGLDILLEAVAVSDEEFILHLVGNVPEELMPLTDDPRIRVHGHLNQYQIRELSAQCWIGLSSFALHRNKMKEACPLKVREYLMLGLPVYGDYEDVFPMRCAYFKTDKTLLNYVQKFAFATRSFTKSGIANLSKDHIDKVSLLQRLSVYLGETEIVKGSCIPSGRHDRPS